VSAVLTIAIHSYRGPISTASIGGDSGFGSTGGRISPPNFLPPSANQFNNCFSGDFSAKSNITILCICHFVVGCCISVTLDCYIVRYLQCYLPI